MKLNELIKADIQAYRRYYMLIMAATLIMVAVITGSFVTGDSVRNTLVDRVEQRLGNTESIIISKNSFFSETLVDTSVFGNEANAVLLVNGFVSDAGRYIPVMVWGIDKYPVDKGEAKINRTLANELTSNDRDLVLRLPATGLMPSGSLFVTKNYTTSARLKINAVTESAAGGDLNLKNEQTIPCNVFVNRAELASILGIEGKINLILSPDKVTDRDLNKVWTPEMSGITVTGNSVTSDKVFLQNELVATLYKPGINRIFSYMANSLVHDSDTIPYSFVTAVDFYDAQTVENGEVILSDYAAERLKAGVGDSISMTFFVSEDLKILHEKEISLRVAKITDVNKLYADSVLSSNFPGLTDVERCTDWNSDMPVDMSRITKDDEDYWTRYRSTPKALVTYAAVAPLWSNSCGCATALLMSETPDLSRLTYSMTGIQIIYPKETGLNAAVNGIDFASLFLSLGFFIIISAVLLLLVPLSEMLFSRRNELSLLSALGFPRRRIIEIVWKELCRMTILASLFGVVAGLLYTVLTVTLLNTLRNDAVHTGGFRFHADLGTFFSLSNLNSQLSIPAGLVIVLSVLRIALARAVRNVNKPPKICPKTSKVQTLFSIRRLICSDLRFNRKRTWLSFAALASGVLIVFSTGLNRRGFTDGAQLQSGTGGYSLWCENSVPVYHNLNTAEGRDKLALGDLPNDVKILQILRYGADDASCLNLNKVSQPTVLGIDFREMKNSDFRISRSIYPSGVDVFETACKMSGDTVCPALIDETVLLWGLQMKIGDTVHYKNSLGKTIKLQLVATLQNSVFQGNLLIDKRLFSKIWNDITGSETALVKAKETQTAEVKRLLETALSEYGARVTATSQRLKEFNSVTDTYLTIFLVLGGLGLLIGLACFIIVVRKDLASRTEQIALLRSLGFTDSKIARLLTAENRIVPVAAIAAGFLISLTAVAGGTGNVSPGVWLTALVLLALLIAGTWLFVKKEVKNTLSHEDFIHRTRVGRPVLLR
jgi:putative ABC transport system permease protein